jgi:hypothetical protein
MAKLTVDSDEGGIHFGKCCWVLDRWWFFLLPLWSAMSNLIIRSGPAVTTEKERRRRCRRATATSSLASGSTRRTSSEDTRGGEIRDEDVEI